MIKVEVYASNQTGIGEPLATLAYSGRGKTVSITTDNISVKEELTSFLNTVLSFPKQGRVIPEDRKLWMESLPVANVSIPYWFKLSNLTSEIIEEVKDGNEEDGNEEGLEDPSGSAVEGDGGSDGDDSDNGSTPDGENPDGGDSDGGFLTHNG